MTTSEYFKEEGWKYYRSWPGIWPTVIVTLGGVALFYLIPDEQCRMRLAQTVCGATATVTGIMLALAITAITFQLGTFSVDDLRNFVNHDEAMHLLEMTRASAKWTINLMIAIFIVGIIVSVLGKWPEDQMYWPHIFMGISIFCIVLAISHVGFAVRAAFDFAKVKTAIAQELERNNQENIN